MSCVTKEFCFICFLVCKNVFKNPRTFDTKIHDLYNPCRIIKYNWFSVNYTREKIYIRNRFSILVKTLIITRIKSSNSFLFILDSACSSCSVSLSRKLFVRQIRLFLLYLLFICYLIDFDLFFCPFYQNSYLYIQEVLSVSL